MLSPPLIRVSLLPHLPDFHSIVVFYSSCILRKIKDCYIEGIKKEDCLDKRGIGPVILTRKWTKILDLIIVCLMDFPTSPTDLIQFDYLFCFLVLMYDKAKALQG